MDLNPTGPDIPVDECEEAGTIGLGTSGSACQWQLSQVKEEPLPETVASASWLFCFWKACASCIFKPVQAAVQSQYGLSFGASGVVTFISGTVWGRSSLAKVGNQYFLGCKSIFN